MARLSYRLIFIFLIVIAGVGLVNAHVFNNALTSRALGLIGSPMAYIFERSSIARTMAGEFGHIKDLTKENARLRQENIALVARIGDREALENENDFLRKSLKITIKNIQPALAAGMFMIDFDPPGYNALINRGSNHGVTAGQVVITEEGVLVGRIKEILPTTSRVQLINDPALEISAQVLGKPTMGITKGNLENGIILNLVVQEDQIAEGDTIISNGNDGFPAGLTIGRVSYIEANDSAVFKKVKIDPAMRRIPLGPVLLLKP